jgi:hypothetical protein
MKLMLTLASLTITGAFVYATSVLFEKKDLSSIKQIKTQDGLIADVVHTQDYKVISTFTTDGNYHSQLLDIKKTVTTYEGADGIQGQIELQLFKTSQNRFDTKIWQIKDDSDDYNLNYQPEAIITLKGGCCGATTGARIYDITSGRLIMSYTPLVDSVGYQKAPFVIEIPNSKLSRLVGVLSPDSTRDFPEVLHKRDEHGFTAAAIIKYATESGIVQKLLLKIKVSEYFAPTLGQVKWKIPEGSKNEIRDGTATLWEIDGSTNANTIGGLHLLIEIYGENGSSLIKIPIAQDRFDLQNSNVPAEVKLIQL